MFASVLSFQTAKEKRDELETVFKDVSASQHIDLLIPEGEISLVSYAKQKENNKKSIQVKRTRLSNKLSNHKRHIGKKSESER